MTVSDWLAEGTKYLEKADIDTARLDALVLLEDCLIQNKAWIFAHPEHELTTKQQVVLKKLLNRRASHEPLAYVRGVCEFYGREFVLTPSVLQPRPESEALIELFRSIVDKGSIKPLKGRYWHIADVGAGSGAIGITVALEIPNCKVEMLEIDKKAAKVAKKNVDLFTLNINVIVSDLLSKSTTTFDVLLCNLPYVPDDYQINLAALHEPKIAIFGGPDGLDIYRKLFDQLKLQNQRPLLILTESLPTQHDILKEIAKKAGYDQLNKIDFVQAFIKV